MQLRSRDSSNQVPWNQEYSLALTSDRLTLFTIVNKRETTKLQLILAYLMKLLGFSLQVRVAVLVKTLSTRFVLQNLMITT
jgi:hypothetical protein